MAHVRIPTPLRGYTQNQSEVSAQGATVGEVLQDLERRYPGIGPRLLDDKGSVRRYVNIFHNEEDIRFLQELSTPVKEGDRITLIPAIAGG
ncbi:ubiquitin-like small modifier protein 1 [Hyalangium rubrum]|uniref:Ubiquitin-like small modifier protein 1 n=1 Tax=Hyalangium rubrum TaxID=3103134 RepID=A0ABU5HAD7_9BACT|nr:ubiquitin-like small modifier protein 1 [Hyalangium sp. s54d21]MDY7230447.1 ubiquitin-like small modifier protein 1 [Hyalangium sp. s54d21]